ncbi:MAG: SET domain-containing protein [Phycisphaerales bacterium]|jgi:SET domain-containing protein|nr:SET domain-containing protein [Phycisphaerales bacterium]
MPSKRPLPHDGVYARIGVSRLHGVGVVAIRPIPKGTLVFAGEDERAAWLDRATVRSLPPAVRALYEDFGMVDGGRIGVPRSLNRLSVGWYVNHADTPNLVAGDDGRFRALRRIRTGEELTADYRTFCDEPLGFRVQTAPTRHARRRGGRGGAGGAGGEGARGRAGARVAD